MSTSPAPTTAGRPSSWPSGIVYRAWKMWFVRLCVIVFLLAAVFLLGGWCLSGRGTGQAGAGAAAAGMAAPSVQYWTCSMHPQIKLPNSGQCPICFMDLIPVQAGTGDADLPRLALNERARVLARVTTTPVEYREVAHELHMVGKVEPDETRITYVSSYVPGRLDRLFVNYTGIFVRPGDHLAEIYSPELLVGQREYLLALENVERTRNAAADNPARQGAEALVEAARRKLELWGFPRDELERLTREHQATDHIRIDAPEGGWVLERQAFEGMYVDTGTRLFTLADLRTVWVLLEAYELDLSFLRYGQRVEFETEAYPGRKFEGRIAYIDPRLTEVTRTVNVRVNVLNEDLQLRTGMFVRARVRVQVGAGGQVIEPSLVGRWICPMHPEIVKDTVGNCDICGMDLVPAESLGFATQQAPGAKVLAVPQTAVLLTGRRAVVYVERTDTAGDVAYEGRVIELGPRTGDWYVVKGGLDPGERVVTRGAFQIDSALQIQARPSMMQPSGESAAAQPPTHDSGPATAPAAGPSRRVAGAMYHQHMRPVLESFIELTEALSGDRLDAALAAAAKLRAGLAQAAPHGLEGENARVFAEQVEAIRTALPPVDGSDLDVLRDRLAPLNTAVEAYLRTFGHDREQPFVRLFCPMAFDNRGASWLQLDDQVRNPYFGRKMYRCGEKRGAIAADGQEVR